MNVGIVGCGQLAAMMAQSAIDLGMSVSFLANEEEDVSCIIGLGKVVRFSEGMSPDNIFRELEEPQVITVEKEQVDVNFLQLLKEFTLVFPDPDAISIAQNRIFEKQILQNFNIPVAPFTLIENREGIKSLSKNKNFPLYIKHPTQGYDGKSQWRIESAEELDAFSREDLHYPLVAEERVEYLYEASLIGVRSAIGDIHYYPPTINTHKNGILHRSYTTSDTKILAQLLPARQILSQLFHHWNYVGVLTVELFVTSEGICVNELAPRVHNSGHWTLDACASSQFENHIRAITGLSLGDTSTKTNAGMLNLLGLDEVPEGVAQGNKVYWYNKTLKPNRKMGHINVISDEAGFVHKELDRLTNKLYIEDITLQESA